jgi:hypothetical protein
MQSRDIPNDACLEPFYLMESSMPCAIPSMVNGLNSNARRDTKKFKQSNMDTIIPRLKLILLGVESPFCLLKNIHCVWIEEESTELNTQTVTKITKPRFWHL